MSGRNNNKRYILLTAARNEEKNIEKTIKSVIGQTIKPAQWIIISDGSTDKTDEIVSLYETKHKFIRFFRASGDRHHNFGSKVKAINFAREQVDIKTFNYIGVIDADISFSEDYFEKLLTKFEENQNLGIGGGIIYEIYNNRRIKQKIDINSVAGAVQLFRTECLKQLGDFIPLKYGGEDAAMEIMARMNTWDVRTFPELEVLHYGYVGRGSGNVFKAKFNMGIRFYQLGYHPIFQTLRCIYRITDWPYLFGAIIELYSYYLCCIKNEPQILNDKTIAFLRKEQMERLKIFRRR
jgi:glycosyltransferase involved in cell wall biosynthesis